MPRNLVPTTISRFKGIRRSDNVRNVQPEYALDCLNVVVSKLGYLEKLRYPTIKATLDAVGLPIPTMHFYTRAADGLRQLIAMGGGKLYKVDVASWASALLGADASYNNVWDAVTSNNVLYLSDGVNSKKYSGGAGLDEWSPPIPAAPPDIGVWVDLDHIHVAAGVATTYFVGPSIIDNFPFPQTGDTIRVRNSPEPLLNGQFQVPPASTGYTWTTAAADGDYHGGQMLIFGVPSLTGYVDYMRSNGKSRLYLWLVAVPLPAMYKVGNNITVVNSVDPTFDGTYPISAIGVDGTGAYLEYDQMLKDVALTVTGAGTFTIVVGSSGTMLWAYSYKNSVTGEEGSASLYSVAMPEMSGIVWAGRHVWFVTAVAPPATHPNIDTIVWYRTYNGGGDLFKYGEYNIATDGLVLIDSKEDGELNSQVRASFINDPVPAGKYLCGFQGRIFIAGINGKPQDIAYTGYDKIDVGRPETVSPQYNRLRLAIGADAIRAIGAFVYGVVAFSQSNEMFMFRGTVEDITLDAPVAFSQELEQLPWAEGALSHYALKSTSHGLIWWGSDLAIKIFTGLGMPKVLSGGVTHILKRRTQGYESNARSFFFNYAERDWYALAFAVDGSTQNNLVLVCDLDPDEEANVGIFVLDIGNVDAIAVADDANGVRHLLITQQGKVKEIQAVSDAIGGVVQGTIAPTAATLPAYWRSGYFGGSTTLVRNMFRFGRISSTLGDWGIEAYVVDGDRYTFDTPLYLNQQQLVWADGNKRKFFLNFKACAASLVIDFPPQDADFALMELGVVHRPLSIR